MTLTQKPNPFVVAEAHRAAYTGKLNMVKCADHCGLTLREFKLTFREYLKYNQPHEWGETTLQLSISGL
jgi:hypothetical protein